MVLSLNGDQLTNHVRRHFICERIRQCNVIQRMTHNVALKRTCLKPWPKIHIMKSVSGAVWDG